MFYGLLLFKKSSKSVVNLVVKIMSKVFLIFGFTTFYYFFYYLFTTKTEKVVSLRMQRKPSLKRCF